MRRTLICALCALLLLLTACAAPTGAEAERSVDVYAMDTYMTLRFRGGGEELPDALRRRILELDGMLSVTGPDSEIARLDREGRSELSPETAHLLRRALEACEWTDGALNIALYPVVKAWGFTTQEYRVPGQDEIDRLLPLCDWRGVTLEENAAALAPGMEIDLGSVAKGYTGDVLAGLLRGAGVTSALLDLGGNIQTVGARPDGTDWRIAIRDPAGEGTLGVVSVRDEAVITSGGYERYFTDEQGRVWWHIMDPATGYPARSGLLSATVVGREGLVCDALSTALFVMGPERACRFWREEGGFEMLLVTDEGLMLATPGLAERFRPEADRPYGLQIVAE